MASAHIITPVVASEFSAPMAALHKKWHQKCHQAIAALLTRKTAPDRAWLGALSSLRDMDGRMLDDLGAPQWAREAVLRQRDQRARAIEQILGGRHGCAGPRLD